MTEDNLAVGSWISGRIPVHQPIEHRLDAGTAGAACCSKELHRCGYTAGASGKRRTS